MRHRTAGEGHDGRAHGVMTGPCGLDALRVQVTLSTALNLSFSGFGPAMHPGPTVRWILLLCSTSGIDAS